MRSVLFAALLLAGCNTPPPPRVAGAIAAEGDLMFTINDSIEVRKNMWEAFVDRIPPEQLARMESAPGGMARVEEQFAMSQLLYNKAMEAKLADDPTVKVGLALAERDYLANKYVSSQGEAAVTDEAIAKRYEERKVQYARPQVKARHILVKEESQANEIKGRIEGGADFSAEAKTHSLDPGSKDKGGELGWFEQRRMDPAFGEAAFAAEKGQLVGPVQSRFGYHLIEVLDKRDSVPLDDVKEEIAGSLRQEAIQGLIQGMQAELKVTRPGEESGAVAQPAPGAAPKGPPGLEGKKLVPAGERTAPSAPPPPKDDNHDGHDH